MLFRSLARLAHSGYGVGLTLTGQKDFDLKRDLPLTESFVGTASNYDAREFSKIKDEVSEVEGKLNMFKTAPEQYFKYTDKNPMAAKMVEIYNSREAKLLRPLQEQANKIRRDPDMTPKERAELLKDNKLNQNFAMRHIIEDMKMLKEYDKD